MKKRIPTSREGPLRFFVCSCGHDQAVNETMPWCSRCGTEYRVLKTSVEFDPGRKTPRFALAKALNVSGGVRLQAELKEGGPHAREKEP